MFFSQSSSFRKEPHREDEVLYLGCFIESYLVIATPYLLPKESKCGVENMLSTFCSHFDVKIDLIVSANPSMSLGMRVSEHAINVADS